MADKTESKFAILDRCDIAHPLDAHINALAPAMKERGGGSIIALGAWGHHQDVQQKRSGRGVRNGLLGVVKNALELG